MPTDDILERIKAKRDEIERQQNELAQLEAEGREAQIKSNASQVAALVEVVREAVKLGNELMPGIFSERFVTQQGYPRKTRFLKEGKLSDTEYSNAQKAGRKFFSEFQKIGVANAKAKGEKAILEL